MSKTLSAPKHLNSIATLFACVAVLLFASAARAQSTDVDQPTPVTSNLVTGRIAARDIGDSRLTRHFFILTGTPGDLVVTVESRNLNGDIDLFQAGTLRPLAKVSMYAGELSTSTSKSIYLRQRETIVLRVEARTPNDDEGTYRVSFSGGFEAMAAPAVQPEADTATETTTGTAARRDKNTRRVNAVGARINEPEPVEPPATEKTDTTSAEKSADAGNKSAADESEPATTTPEPVTTARTQRPPTGRRTGRRRGRVTPSRPPESSTQDNSTAAAGTEEPPPIVSKPTGIETGAKLIIETRDGMRVERFMSTVRRVTVENGQIVVITRDGKVTRHPMADVVRMAIEP